jgi:tetratricopeptide (TPR) repeat protein
MPARAATDVAHAAITDHRILPRPEAEPDRTAPRDVPVAWREPAPEFRQRDQAIADLTVASDERSAPLARQALRLLLTLPNPVAQDPDVLSALGSMMLQQKMPRQALNYFQEAAREQPRNANEIMNAGIASEYAGDIGAAISSFERAIDLDPSLQRAYFELARLYESNGQEGASIQTVRRYLKLFPESIDGRLLLTGP